MPKLITKRETKPITLTFSIFIPWLMVALLIIYILWLTFSPKPVKTPNACAEPILELLGGLPFIPQAPLSAPNITSLHSLQPQAPESPQPSAKAESASNAHPPPIGKPAADLTPVLTKKPLSTLPSINPPKTSKSTAKTSHFIPKANHLLPDATTRQPTDRASQIKAKVKANAATSTASPAAQPHDFQIMEESLGISLGP